MDQVLLQKAIKLNKARRRRKYLRRFVGVMGVAVTFVTTYMLILPAITMEKQAYCGLDAHAHTDACYSQVEAVLACAPAGEGMEIVHTHGALCYDDNGQLRCDLPELEAHTHDAGCYGSETELVCSVAEAQDHVHGDDCYEKESVLSCGLEECEPHTHAEDCFRSQRELACGLPECEPHDHEESCYTRQQILICKEPERKPHAHGEDCYEMQQTCVCGLNEDEDHAHEEACYEQMQVQICNLEEDEGHFHAEDCYEAQEELNCAVELPEGHTHSDDCYQDKVETVCDLEESEGHTHGDDCYTEQDKQICQWEEAETHTHDEGCYLVRETLICEKEEVILHSHTEECYEEDAQHEKHLICRQPVVVEHIHDESCLAYTNQELICETTEHIHTDICYEPVEETTEPVTEPTESMEETAEPVEETTEPVEETTEPVEETTEPVEETTEPVGETTEPVEETTGPAEEPTESEEGIVLNTEQNFRCGFGAHLHGDACFEPEGKQLCTVPEHTHNAGCVLADYDPLADVETQEQWEASLQEVVLSGRYRDDVLAIARTQLAYGESLQNRFLREDGTTDGYTRYGDWYGPSYDRWDAMFVSFCLRYADVAVYPVDSDCRNWISQLENMNFYRDARNHEPRSGELIFFDLNRDGNADRVGLVSEATVDRIIAIEGDNDDAVRYCSYTPGDPIILGYGLMPESRTIQQEHIGEDYAVSVSYGADGGLPPDAQLVVTEIPQDSEEYRYYLEQAVDAMQDDSEDEVETDVSFARFFDIQFVVNGEKVEPTAPVQISIRYDEAVQLGQEDVGRAVHFADSGIEILATQTSGDDSDAGDAANTFVYTQDSFSVSGTVVINNGNSRAASIDLSNAESIGQYITSISITNQNGEETTMFLNGDTFAVTIDASIYGWQYGNRKDKTLYLILAEQMKLTGLSYSGNAESGMIDSAGNAALLVAPMITDQWGNPQNVSLRMVLTGKAINETGGTANVSIHNVVCNVYHSSQSFTHTATDGTVTELNLMGSSYSPSSYELVVEQEDASGYANAIRSFVQSNYVRREMQGNAVYRVYLRSKSNPSTVKEITGPYSLSMHFADSPVPVSKGGSAIVLNLNGNQVQKPGSGAAVCSDGAVTTVTISDTHNKLTRFSVTALSGMTAGTTGSGYSLAYNTVTDAFIKDPAYQKYFNRNSPIGTAGSFHLVGFDTVTLSSHTNGNILAKNLYAGENFGTNNYPNELTYVQNYRKVHATSASSLDHILVIGSSNTLDLYDNNNRYKINSVGMDKPKHIIQDEDTNAAPFIDLNRVRAEIRQLSSVMAGFAPNNLLPSVESQNRVLTLTQPDSVGVITVDYPDPRVFGSAQLDLKGFRSGTSGSIVINVNCAGASTIRMPTALVYIDGQVQGTDEVTNFTSGKVVWNFINAQGVTIEAQRMTGMIIAPGATVNINQNLNGTVVADVINVLAESHRTDFTGEIIPRETVDYGITLRKIRSGYVGTTLSGAEFTLEIWNGSRWTSVNTGSIITDADGLFLLKNLKKDTAYRLVETKAPVGYTPLKEPYCFWVRSNASMNQPNTKPSGFDGLALDTGATLNIPNEPDEQINTTQLQLEKKWLGESPVLAERITVMVYQITLREEQEIQRSLYKTVILTKALDWKLTLEDLPLEGKDASGNPVSYAYSVEEKEMEGYTASYSDNNEAGTRDDTIVITNKERTYGYELPETGGIGTGHFTGWGMILLFAFGCAMAVKRRKREADK